MRVEVNDEAAQLRRRATPIRCAGHDKANPTRRDEPQSPATADCDDCGGGTLACRCNPGEG